jgi:hypothetical protein
MQKRKPSPPPFCICQYPPLRFLTCHLPHLTVLEEIRATIHIRPRTCLGLFHHLLHTHGLGLATPTNEPTTTTTTTTTPAELPTSTPTHKLPSVPCCSVHRDRHEPFVHAPGPYRTWRATESHSAFSISSSTTTSTSSSTSSFGRPCAFRDPE